MTQPQETGRKSPENVSDNLDFHKRIIARMLPSDNIDETKFINLVADDLVHSPYGQSALSNKSQSPDQNVVRAVAWSTYFNLKRFGCSGIEGLRPEQLTSRVLSRVQAISDQTREEQGKMQRTGT